MKIKYCLIILIVLLVSSSCKKADNRACWKTNGEQTEIIDNLNDFSVIKLNNNIKYNISTDGSNRIRIKAPKNLIKFIDYGISDGVLKIENNNKCHFIREYRDIEITLSLKSIDSIHFSGNNNLNLNINQPEKTLELKVSGNASGDISGIFNLKRLAYRNYAIESTVSANLTGYANNLEAYHNGYGQFNSKNMNTNYSFFANRSNNDIKVFANENATLEIYRKGNIEINQSCKSIQLDVQNNDGTVKYY